MVIRRIEDIERDKARENRERVKKEITEDVNDVIDNVFKRPKKGNGIFGFIWGLIKFLGLMILLLVVVNFLLGNIWLLRFFIKSLFLKS